MRVDEKTRFQAVRLLSGQVLEGKFTVERPVGDLAYTQQLFASDGQVLIPMSSVAALFLVKERAHDATWKEIR